MTSEKKLMFRYAETVSGPILKPRLPMVFGVVDDSGETRDLFTSRIDCLWVMQPIMERLGAFQRSVAQYPNIKRSGVHGLSVRGGPSGR